MAFITFSNDIGYYTGSTKNLLGASLNSSNQNIIFILKSLLKTAGWTVPASWKTGNLTRTLGSDVHVSSFEGWVALQHPTSNRTFLVSGSGTGGIKMLYSYYGFDYAPTGSGLPSSSLGVSVSPATYSLWPSGSSTSYGRGRDGVYVIGSGLDYTAGTFETFNAENLPLNTCYVQILAENTEPYRFWVSTYSTGSAVQTAGAFLFFDKSEDNTFVSDDIDPYVFGFLKTVSVNSQTALDPYTMANNQPLGIVPGNRTPFPGFSMATEKNGVPDGYFAPTGLMNYTQNRDSTGWARTVVPASQVVNPFGLNFNIYENVQSIDLFSLPWSIGANYLSSPSSIYSAYGYKGASSMILGTGTSLISNGTTLDTESSGSRDKIVVGSYALNWDGSEASGSGGIVQSFPGILRFPVELWKIRGVSNNNWFTGGFAIERPLEDFITGSAGDIVYIYRGILAGNYVYSTGTPPIGASDIVIIGKL